MIDNKQDRLNAVILRFKKFELDTSDPKWSSYALDRFFEEVMSTPGGSIQDVYHGLDGAEDLFRRADGDRGRFHQRPGYPVLYSLSAVVWVGKLERVG